MRISVKVTVEMTPEQLTRYCDINGIERGDVRGDVKDYIRTALQDSPAFTDCQADVVVA